MSFSSALPHTAKCLSHALSPRVPHKPQLLSGTLTVLLSLLTRSPAPGCSASSMATLCPWPKEKAAEALMLFLPIRCFLQAFHPTASIIQFSKQVHVSRGNCAIAHTLHFFSKSSWTWGVKFIGKEQDWNPKAVTPYTPKEIPFLNLSQLWWKLQRSDTLLTSQFEHRGTAERIELKAVSHHKWQGGYTGTSHWPPKYLDPL